MPDPSLIDQWIATQEKPAASPGFTQARVNIYDEAGNPLRSEDVPSALASGKAYFDADQTYNLLTPNSAPHQVKGDQVYNALRQGWALESDEARELRRRQEAAGPGEKALAAGAGALETLSFGTAPAIAEIVGGMGTGSKWKKVSETAPGYHTAGEVAGLLTPMGVEALAERGVAKGLAGTVAKGVTAAPRGVSRLARVIGEKAAGALPEASSVVGRAARKGFQLGVEGAFEGSIYGAGHAIGEAALGDKELAAEKVLADAAGGAFLGAGIGAGLGGAGSLVASGAERLAAAAPGFAERLAFRTTGARGSDFRRVGLEQAKRSGRRMLDEGLVGFESLEERAAALRKATEDAGKQVDHFVRSIDELGQKPDLAPIVKKLDEQMGELRASLHGGDTKLARKLERENIDQLRDELVSGKATFKKLHSFRARVDDYKAQASRKGDQTEYNELVKIRKTIEDELATQADNAAHAAGGDFKTGYTAAKARYKDLIAATQIAERQAPQQAGNRTISLTDTIAMGAGLAHGAVGAVATGVANKLVREYGDVAGALAIDKLSRKKPTLAEVMGAAPKPANEATAPTDLYNRLLRGDVPEAEWQFLREGGYERGANQLNRAYSGPASANDVATGRVVPPGGREPLPPIKVVIDSGELHLRDGRHRLKWAQDNGATEIRAEIIDAATGKSTEQIIPVPGAARGSNLKEIRSKLEALGYVKERADKVSLQLSKAAKDAVSGSAYKVIPKVPAGAAAYEKLSADAREHQLSPDRSATRIAARVAPLVSAAPELSSAINAKMVGDIEYLASKLPPAGLAGLTPEQAKKVVPAGSTRASFVREARAIENPRTAIFDMKKGQLSADAIKAIQERRPLLLTKIQEEAEAAYAQLIKEGKAPSRQMRLQLSRLLGRNIDPASHPTVIRIVQKTYQEQASAMAAPVSPTPQSSTKRADRLMSYSETIAYGEQ